MIICQGVHLLVQENWETVEVVIHYHNCVIQIEGWVGESVT